MKRNTKIRLISAFLLLSVFALFALTSCGVSLDYEITVKDSSGNPIENAKVAILEKGSEQEIISTDKDGKILYKSIKGREVTARIDSLPEGYKIPENSEISLKSGEVNGFIIPVKSEYSVTVKTAAGAPLKDVLVQFYSDSQKTDLKAFATTDSQGKAEVKLVTGAVYYADLVDISAGYKKADFYEISEGDNSISLATEIIKGEAPAGHKYSVGDVMYDFTVTTVDGKVFTLSEVLEERGAVMLNFWYINCNFCIAEFTHFDEVLGSYQDKIGIIALNNYIDDTALEVRDFVEEKRLKYENNGADGIAFTFDVAKGGEVLSSMLAGAREGGIWTSWPVSFMIDRWGVICLAVETNFKSAEELSALLDYFTAEDYQQRIFEDYQEFLDLTNQ